MLAAVFIWQGVESECLQTRPFVSGLPVLRYGISTHALPGAQGKNSRFVRDLRSQGLTVFGRWCVEEAGLFCVNEKNNKLRVILDARRPDCCPCFVSSL